MGEAKPICDLLKKQMIISAEVFTVFDGLYTVAVVFGITRTVEFDWPSQTSFWSLQI